MAATLLTMFTIAQNPGKTQVFCSLQKYTIAEFVKLKGIDIDKLEDTRAEQDIEITGEQDLLSLL